MFINEREFSYQYRNNGDIKGTPIPDDGFEKLIQKTRSKSISQINEEFYELILELMNTASEYSQEEKNQTAEDLANYYFKLTGYLMPSTMLTPLADFLLDDIFIDRSVDKVTNTEYPILNHRQIKRRKARQFAVENDILEYFDSRNRYNIAEKKRTGEKPDRK